MIGRTGVCADVKLKLKVRIVLGDPDCSGDTAPNVVIKGEVGWAVMFGEELRNDKL